MSLTPIATPIYESKTSFCMARSLEVRTVTALRQRALVLVPLIMVARDADRAFFQNEMHELREATKCLGDKYLALFDSDVADAKTKACKY
jgi:hypothetical protein